MNAILGVKTCDKCDEEMGEGQKVLIIAEGIVSESGDVLDLHDINVRYACHLYCWDEVEGE